MILKVGHKMLFASTLNNTATAELRVKHIRIAIEQCTNRELHPAWKSGQLNEETCPSVRYDCFFAKHLCWVQYVYKLYA